jgi:hypothetical protein
MKALQNKRHGKERVLFIDNAPSLSEK